MRFTISIQIPDGMLTCEQEMYLEELRKKLRQFSDKVNVVGDISNSGTRLSIASMPYGLIYESDPYETTITIDQPVASGCNEFERKCIVGDIIPLVGYAIAASTGDPTVSFPNIPIKPLFGEMFIDPDAEDKTPQEVQYIAQGSNPFEHRMEDIPDDQEHIVLDFIVPKVDDLIPSILPTVFDKNPKLVETDTTDVYITEEWFSGEPKLVCSFNLLADSSDGAIEHSAELGQAFIEEIRDRLIEKNESE